MLVYADNAATTAMSRTAIDAMLPYFDKIYGNPSSLHSVGQEAKEALDTARETVAGCLGCEPREIYFTSGGSEADNQAILSAARLGERKGKKHAPGIHPPAHPCHKAGYTYKQSGSQTEPLLFPLTALQACARHDKALRD